jgi:hypothetical protein
MRSGLVLLLTAHVLGWCAGPDAWIPARWVGGPLEVEQRVKTNSAPTGPAEREALANWYAPVTLDLLKDSPINCLVVTWSAPAGEETLKRQRELVKSYAAEAHRRGLSVVGLIYAGKEAAQAAKAAAEASLDGVVFEGDSAADLAREAAKYLPAIAAVEGVSPSARRLAEMGIRSGPSSEPWIESNIWLVRSLDPAKRPVWITYPVENPTAIDYERAVADAAVAGGHWIIAPDDKLRAGLWGRDPAAMETWRRMTGILRFAQNHLDWKRFTPYGNVAILSDTGSDAEEYLKLVARRQVPYRLLSRAEFKSSCLSRFTAVVQVSPPSDSERKVLTDFVEKGGLLVASPSWGGPPKDERYVQRSLGKGRLVTYKDSDPESVAHDLRDLLSQEEMGITAFNVPSVITSASVDDSGRRVLVQLLNYSNSPAEAITIRVQGKFNSARLYAPEAAPSDLTLDRVEGHVDVSIPRLPLWGAVLLE